MQKKTTLPWLTKKYLYNKQTPIPLRDLSLLSVEHYVKALR